MGVSQHPSEELRSSFSLGNLAPGAALAVAAHLEFCDTCRLAVWRTESHRWRPRSRPRADETPTLAGSDGSLPKALKDVDLGAWRAAGLRVRTAPLRGVSGLGESIHMLKAAPRASLPLPPAAELLLVLNGTLHIGGSTCHPGDLLQLAAFGTERARADARAGCLCLVVGDDDLYRRPLRDWLLGRG